MEDPNITDAALIAGVRALRADPALDVAVRKRRRLRPTAGLTGSYFERVTVRVAGRDVKAVLKAGGMPYGPQTRERLFFERLAHDVPMRVPAAYGAGTLEAPWDGWVLMEALPRGKRIAEWPAEATPQALRNLAALHARYLDCAPAELPRPWTRDLDQTLDFVQGGISALREKYAALPHFPRAVSERSLELLAALLERREIFRPAFSRSPETLLHGDYHRGNLLVRDGEPQCVFDWQFVSAGPPAYDLAVFWLWLGAVNKRGFFRLIDRTEFETRCMTWEQVLDTYSGELVRLRPDADIGAILSCSQEALAWECVRQVTYFAHGIDNFAGLVRFIYRDHRTVGGLFARWLGLEAGWRMYEEVFADFEGRAERLLAGGPVQALSN